MNRLLPLYMQCHAVLAAGHQHGLGVERAGQFRCRRGDIGLGGDRAMHGGGEFLAVRRHQRRAAIEAVIMRLGIDDHRLAEAARAVDDGADDPRCQHTLGVIGHHHRADLGQRRFGIGDDGGLALRPGGLRRLPVRPHQMRRMMFGHEAHLARCLPSGVDHQIGHDRAAELAERIGQRQPGLVVADQADENAARPERRNVARDVAGAADFDLVVADREHRRRRFGRNARDVAIDEIVKHKIADAENGLLRRSA